MTGAGRSCCCFWGAERSATLTNWLLDPGSEREKEIRAIREDNSIYNFTDHLFIFAIIPREVVLPGHFAEVVDLQPEGSNIRLTLECRFLS